MRGLRWEEEHYTRLHRRDTADWLLLSVEAQGVYALLRRKADRAGLIDLGRAGLRAVAAVLGHPSRWPDYVEPAIRELLADGWVEDCGQHLLIPEYLESEEAQASPAQRQRVHRERARDQARARSVLGPRDVDPDPVTLPVTQGVTLPVTPGSHVDGHDPTSPLPSVPTDPSVPLHARARVGEREEELREPADPDPVEATRAVLVGMPAPVCWLTDLRAEERLAAGCFGGQTRIEDIVAAVNVAATTLGPELGAVERGDVAGLRRVEAFVARRVASEPMRRRSRGGAPSPRAVPVRAVACAAAVAELLVSWSAKYEAAPWGYGPYRAGDVDERLAERLIVKAQAIAEQDGGADIEAHTRAIIAQATDRWFGDEYFQRSAHSLSWFTSTFEREPGRFLVRGASGGSNVAPLDDDPPPDSRPLRLPIESAPPEIAEQLRSLGHGPGPVGARPQRGGPPRRPSFEELTATAVNDRHR